MDLKIRELERAGRGPRYWAACYRADLFPSGLVHGPLSILDAICASCGDVGLEWSNCSYCAGCHLDRCVVGNISEECARAGAGRIRESWAPTCNNG